MAMEAQRQAEVAARLVELRGVRPQRWVADRVGVQLRSYQNWEAGKGIKWENVERLAEIHGVSDEWLLYGDEGAGAHGTQLDRLEKKVDALLSGLNEARALQARTHEILAANDRIFRERIAEVGARVNELQEHVDGRLEELRLEAVEDVAAGFAEAPQRTGRAGPSPARTTGGPGEAPPRPAPAGGSRE